MLAAGVAETALHVPSFDCIWTPAFPPPCFCRVVEEAALRQDLSHLSIKSQLQKVMAARTG